MQISNVKIAVKILLALGLMVVFSVGITGTALWNLRGLDRTYSDLFDQESQASLWLARSNSLLNATARDAYLMVAEEDQAAIKKAFEAADSDAKGTIERMEKAMRAMPAISGEVGDMKRAYEGLFAVVNEVKDKASRNEDEAARKLIATKFEPTYMDVRLKFRALIDRVDKQTQVKSDLVSEVSAKADLWIILVGSIGLLISAGIALLLVQKSITKPIRLITGTMRTLAEGNLETAIHGAERGDEIGDMARAVRVFKDNALERTRLEAAAAEDRRKREERVATVERLIDSFEQHVSDIMNAVSAASTELEHTAESMKSTATRTNDRAAAAADAAREASANVQTVAAASEQLSASISEISGQVTQSSTIAQKAVSEAEQTNTRVQGLVEQAHRIGEIVDLINSIAGQTNLLALNATIEAARAGEAGKGFAVVASEVKSLANQTAKATEEIARQITAMQGATDGAATAIDGIGQTISTISGVAATIAAAVEEQGAATGEIARNVQQAASGTASVSANVADVSEAATLTGAAAGEVFGASGELARQSANLKIEVEKFLTGIRAA